MTKNTTLKLSPKESANRSQENLKNKLTILKSWVKFGIPWKILEDGKFERNDNGNRVPIHYPDSLRSFNKWNHTKYSNATLQAEDKLKSITGNGSDTLNKYLEIKNSVTTTLMQIKKIILIQVDSEGPNQIKKIKAANAQLKAFIENQALDIIQLQQQNMQLNDSASGLMEKHQGDVDEIYANYKELEKENTSFKKEISHLKKQLMKVTSIRVIN